MTSFIDRLTAGIQRVKNPVLVGLDPRLENLPAPLNSASSPGEAAKHFETFCNGIIDVVAPLVSCVKPQLAFFEKLGPAGMQALANVVQHARDSGLLVILDGKRNDIGTTATAYAEAYLGATSNWGGDALTVSPYLGDDSLTPFVEVCRQRDAGIFVLVKTSNPGGGLLQDLKVDGLPIYRHIGAFVEQLAGETLGAAGFGAVGAVVGATYPEQLAELRQAMPRTWFLIPGYGAQGGTAKDCAAAFDSRGLGAIVNNSRGIIFAHERKEYKERFGAPRWQDAVAAATNEMIEQFRLQTTTGNL
jgi:orotidine-5'-phosphate decarboxylase